MLVVGCAFVAVVHFDGGPLAVDIFQCAVLFVVFFEADAFADVCPINFCHGGVLCCLTMREVYGMSIKRSTATCSNIAVDLLGYLKTQMGAL